MFAKYIIISALFTSSLMTLFLFGYAVLKLKSKGSKAYAGLMLSVCLYSFGYGLELAQTTLEGIRFALRIEYLGIPYITSFWLIMAIQYTRFTSRIPKLASVALFVVPAMTTILHFTNHHHHLFYSAIHLNTHAPFPIADLTKGIFYHVSTFYYNICFLLGNILFLWMFIHSVGHHRNQARLMLFVSLIPWFGHTLYQIGATPYGIDIIPFTLTITGPLFAIALFKLRMFDLMPIAQRLMFNVIRDPVLVVDNLNRIIDFNKSATTLFPELHDENIINHDFNSLERVKELFQRAQCANGDMVNNYIHEYKQCCDENIIFFECTISPIRSDDNDTLGRLLIMHDITSSKLLIDKLHDLSVTDALTKIFNRRAFMEKAEEELQRAVRFGYPSSFILIDLDFFKRINDNNGHQAGDTVLVQVADTINDQLRSFDIFGRYGGEEFVVMLPQTDTKQGSTIAERLCETLEGLHIEHDEEFLSITASFGVSGFDAVGNGDILNDQTVSKLLETQLHKADEALYEAKQSGRNCVRTFNDHGKI